MFKTGLPLPTLRTIAAFVCAVWIAGCSSQLPDLPSDTKSSSTGLAGSPTTGSAPRVGATLELSVLVGPPPNVANQISYHLNNAAEKVQVALLNYAGAGGEYRLNGFLAIAPKGETIELTYVWDTFNAQGQSVGRSSGTEVFPATPGIDAWASVPHSILSRIAEAAITEVVVQRAADVTTGRASRDNR